MPACSFQPGHRTWLPPMFSLHQQLPGSFTFTCVQESCTLMLNDDLLIPFTLLCRGEG